MTGDLDGEPKHGSLLVYLPKGYVEGGARRFPLVLALHGWNHSPETFRDKGDLARHADQHGVVLAVPRMGKSIYETSLYPETKGTGLEAPGTRWVGEVILPWMRAHYAVLRDRAHTAAIGYSTGGRGAVFLAERYPELAFAGSLSGTFSLMRLAPKEGEYEIHKVVYGDRTTFPARWTEDDIVTPANLARLAGTRLYIGHGAADASVNPDQLDALRDAPRHVGRGRARRDPGRHPRLGLLDLAVGRGLRGDGRGLRRRARRSVAEGAAGPQGQVGLGTPGVPRSPAP